MEKLEAVQKVLRFSTPTREWCINEFSVHFDDFDEQNVDDYELHIGVFRKALKTGWFLLSALFTDSLKRSINSTNSVNSVLLDNFYHKFIIVT